MANTGRMNLLEEVGRIDAERMNPNRRAEKRRVVGAHGVAKHKFPKYKKFMERNITIKDGKVKLVPKKKD